MALTPIMDPDREWRLWFINQIYDGTESGGRMVPNPDDLVFSYDDGLLRVVDVDYNTGLSTLEAHDMASAAQDDDFERDVLLGTGPGRVSESYRLYLDTSVTPYVINFDSRMKMYGTSVAGVQVLRGSNIAQGTVVSRYYNSDGVLQGDTIPMETVEGECSTQPAIKVPMEGYCGIQLDDGETVTAVFYDDAGHVQSTAVLLVKNTHWIRRSSPAVKYVASIHLESSFLSASENNQIDVPVNIHLSSVPMTGVVTYSDGEQVKLPLTGSKFKLMGANNFVPSIVGQKQPVTLVYYFGSDEQAYESYEGAATHITESYKIATTAVEGAYSLKLFSYPEWISSAQGYRLRHFLYNLEREFVFDVTQKVTLASNSPAFLPKGYGYVQDLVLRLPMEEVDAQFRDYTHLQNYRVTLNGEAPSTDAPWSVRYEQGEPSFSGYEAVATYDAVNQVFKTTIDNGEGSKEDWLREVYRKTYPLYHPNTEAEAPAPDRFKLIVGEWSMERLIDDWDAEIGVAAAAMDAGTTVYLQFMLDQGSLGTYQLATAGLVVRRPDLQ